MKSTAKTLALGAALLCLLAGGMALPASAAVPLTGTAVSLPWNSDNSVPAESIEAGTYSSNMLLGETQQLSPTVRPRNSTDSVIYLTDDSSVLTVSNSGVVQAVGVGTATVTAAAGNQICAYTISVSMDSTMMSPRWIWRCPPTPSMWATRCRHRCRCGPRPPRSTPPSP